MIHMDCLKHGITLSDAVGLTELKDALVKLQAALTQNDSAAETSLRRKVESDLSMFRSHRASINRLSNGGDKKAAE